MVVRGSSRSLLRSKYVGIGILTAGLYWLLEALAHVYLYCAYLFPQYTHGTFLSYLFPADMHEVSKRLLISALIVGFSLYAQHGINVRRRTEEALATSERKYRTLIQEALNPVFVVDTGGRMVEHNLAAQQFFEMPAEELASKRYQDLFWPRSDGGALGAHVVIPGQLEVNYHTKGSIKTLLLNLVPFAAEDGRQLYFGIGQDFTERKRIQVNLQLAHAELHQIFNTASAAMRVIDAHSNVLRVNQTFVGLSGITEEEAIGAKCFDVFAGDKCHTPECPLVRILNGAKEIEYDLTKTRNDGTTVSCLLTARPFMDQDGQPVGIVESFKDITELARVQEELRTERDRLRHILFQQFEGVGIIRGDFTIEYQNEALRQELGNCVGQLCYAALRGRTMPCPCCYMEEAITSGKLQHCEFEVVAGRVHEHTYTPFRDANGEEKVLVLLRDITERKASRASVIRSEQLAALGELAAGVAHEINNPMNGIINYAQMLINRDRGHEYVKDIASRVVAEGDRVAKIVESLLAFARRESQVRVPIHIQDILSDSLTLTGAQIRKDGIDLAFEVPMDLPRVHCIPQEIQQVFLNLLSNARYALNERYPSADRNKRLRITAGADGNGASRNVTVLFEDSGVGIPVANLAKVMNPFFSTKPKGKGTGLGLSICNEIVQEHGGRLTIDSVEGEFTRVSVTLPQVTA